MLKGNLVFAAGNFGNYDIYLYDLGSKKQTQLTSDNHWNDYPRFSPDGRQIAFGSTRDGGKQEIWLMNTDGSGAKSLTPGLKWADFPTWSPDGKEIAFVSNEYFQVDIFALHLETGKLRRLTQNTGFDCYPDWSPDGKQIAFCSERGMTQDIYLLNLETLEEKRITTHPGPDTSPAFHPDGKKIAFVSHGPAQKEGYEFMRSFWDFFHGHEQLDIWVVDLASGKLQQLTTNRGVDRNVRWSPDGEYFAYTSSAVGHPEAGIMFCEYATGKTTPLRIDESMEKRDLERPFVASLNEPAVQDSPWLNEEEKEDVLYKMGQKMLPMMGRATPDFAHKAIEQFQKWAYARVQNWEVDRLHPVTARYLDWK